MAKYKVIAKAKDTKCPWVQIGDKIVIENNMLNLRNPRTYAW